jgi:hypothetical protein
MAASARDARRKSIAPGAGLGKEDTPDVGVDEGDKDLVVVKGKRRAIMRKKPLFTRSVHLPFGFLEAAV